MMFVRYKGTQLSGLLSAGKFTEGKVYLARPDMDSAETVGIDWFEVTADDGKSVRLKPSDGYFEFLDEVYAVILRKSLSRFLPGNVAVLDGASADGFLKVKGAGLYLSDNFIILDRTNVFPGLVVLNSAGQWKKVLRVNERLEMMVEDSGAYHSPLEFRFAVAEDDIFVEPIVRCIMADGEPNLTKGKLYRLLWTTGSETMTLYDDFGAIREFMADRFVLGR